jgi:hypothetical protein
MFPNMDPANKAKPDSAKTAMPIAAVMPGATSH